MTGTTGHVIVYKDGLVYAEGDTDSEGIFSAALVAGDYEIHVQKAGFADIVKTVTLTEAEELMVNFTSPPPTDWTAQESISENVIVSAIPPQGYFPPAKSGLMLIVGAFNSPGISENALCVLGPTVTVTISETASAHK